MRHHLKSLQADVAAGAGGGGVGLGVLLQLVGATKLFVAHTTCVTAADNSAI